MRVDLGDVAVEALVENPRLLIEPEEFFPQLAGDRSGRWFREPWFDASADRLVYAIQAFLVRTPDEVVLVDACVGDAKERRRPEFDRQARGLPVAPDEVTTVGPMAGARHNANAATARAARASAANNHRLPISTGQR